MPTSTEKLTNPGNQELQSKSAQAQGVGVVKRILRPFVPMAVRKIRQDLKLRRWRQKALGACAGLSVEETFETVYAKQLWGGEGSQQFYSGGGSDISMPAGTANLYVNSSAIGNKVGCRRGLRGFSSGAKPSRAGNLIHRHRCGADAH